LKAAEAKELAAFALTCESASDILARCQELAHQIAPGLFDDSSGMGKLVDGGPSN